MLILSLFRKKIKMVVDRFFLGQVLLFLKVFMVCVCVKEEGGKYCAGGK